jgi:hypothetical protein
VLGYGLFGSAKIPFQKIFGYGKRVIYISLENSIVLFDQTFLKV